MEKINASSILGFYYLIFQSYPGKYVKCWMDGDQDFNIYSHKEILSMCKDAKINTNVIKKLQNCFTETSIFLWDVEKETITRLSSKIEPSNIGESIANLKNQGNSSQKNSMDLNPLWGWKSSISNNNGNISIKF